MSDENTIYAYPQGMSSGSLSVSQGGMTLRDYFAGQCLASVARSDISTEGSRKGVAEWAYAQADAMLVERAK